MISFMTNRCRDFFFMNTAVVVTRFTSMCCNCSRPVWLNSLWTIRLDWLLTYATGVEFCFLLFRMMNLIYAVIGWSRYVKATYTCTSSPFVLLKFDRWRSWFLLKEKGPVRQSRQGPQCREVLYLLIISLSIQVVSRQAILLPCTVKKFIFILRFKKTFTVGGIYFWSRFFLKHLTDLKTKFPKFELFTNFHSWEITDQIFLRKAFSLLKFCQSFWSETKFQKVTASSCLSVKVCGRVILKQSKSLKL